MPKHILADRNLSQAAETEKILKLLALDWAQTPYPIIMKEFDEQERKRFYVWRTTPLYQETLKQMTEEHQKRLLEMPSTFTLRQFINYGMGLAVRRLIDILGSQHVSNKDVIAAARLTAQLDGRFLRTDQDGDVPIDEKQESIASELMRALERAKTTVQ